jgi:hypothetical protein
LPESWRADGYRAGGLFLAGAVVAMVYTATWGGKPQFWQDTTFMQGLAWVCGQGWENLHVDDVPGLAPFLAGETDCFDCAAIPPDARVLPRDVSGMPWAEIDAYHPEPQFSGFLAWQRYHLYLVLAVTGLWWAFGVCWSALLPLPGLLYGASCALGYGIFRLGMGRAFATAGALLLLTSPLHLQMAPHLRDYAKAPFTLAAVLLLGLLLRDRRSARATLALCAACGAVAGLGMGFRTDTAIVVPAALVVVLVFLPGPLRGTWAVRLGGAAAVVAAFVAAGFPVLVETARESGHFCHVALLGFLAYCDQRLGVAAPLYDLGDPFSDFYLLSVVQAHQHRVDGTMPPSWVMMPPYHEATVGFFRHYLWTFPADVVFRAWTAVLRVLDEMRPDPASPWPRNLTNPALQGAYALRQGLLDWVPAGGRHHALAALLCLGALAPRKALGAAFVLLWFAGYPSIQFNLRHAFHVEIFGLWCLLFSGYALWRLCAGLRAAETAGPGGARALLAAWPGHLAQALLVVAVLAAAYALPLAGLRAWQGAQVRSLAGAVAVAGRTPLSIVPIPLAGGGQRLLPTGLRPSDPRLPLAYHYLAVTVAPGPDPVPLRFAFEAANREHWDFTRTVSAPAGPAAGGGGTVYFPLYQSGENRFLGIDVPPGLRDRIVAVEEVTGADHLPLWMTWRLPPDWAAQAMHQIRTR